MKLVLRHQKRKARTEAISHHSAVRLGLAIKRLTRRLVLPALFMMKNLHVA
jgi:hypothetical protein